MAESHLDKFIETHGILSITHMQLDDANDFQNLSCPNNKSTYTMNIKVVFLIYLGLY